MQYLTNYKDETFEKVRTTVFVDYEAWFYGCRNQYKTEPDVLDWFNHVKDKGQIDDVLFFADFAHEAIKDHIVKLRNISNSIIDCSKGEKTKDYTDFIMLDHIYQRLFRQPDIKHFILFTGDSHFQSIVAFLRNFNEKKVGIYAIDGSLSPLLAEAANWYTRVVPSSGRVDAIKRAITKNLAWVSEKDDVVPTFTKTVTVVARNNPEYSDQDVSAVLSSMITLGLIRQEEAIIPYSGHLVKKLILNGHKSNPITVTPTTTAPAESGVAPSATASAESGVVPSATASAENAATPGTIAPAEGDVITAIPAESPVIPDVTVSVESEAAPDVTVLVESEAVPDVTAPIESPITLDTVVQSENSDTVS